MRAIYTTIAVVITNIYILISVVDQNLLDYVAH